MLKNQKLSVKLITIMLLLALIPFSLLSIYALSVSQKSISLISKSKLNVYGSKKRQDFENWLQQGVAQLKVMAASRDIYQPLNTLKATGWNLKTPVWTSQVENVYAYMSSSKEKLGLPAITLIGGNGTIAYNTTRNNIGADLRNRDYYIETMKGEPYISNISYSPLLKDYTIIIGVPVFSAGDHGEVIGVLSILLRSRDINQLVLNGIGGIGKTADVYLVNPEGTLVTKPQYSQLTPFKDKIHTHAAQRLVSQLTAGQTDFEEVSQYKNFRGGSVLGYYGILHIGKNMEGIIVEVAAEEVLHSIRELQSGLLFFCLTMIGVILVISWSFARSISKPIIYSISGLSESSNQVTVTARQLATSSQQLSEASTEQASSIEETSSTIQEASSMIQQNSLNTKQAAQLSDDTKQAAENGNQEMQAMLNSMHEIKKSSDKVSKIIKVIDDIAFQTNILALNAAIEAARAGEAGMGFAVVAEEVRNLAQRSAQAVKETTEIIEDNMELSDKGVNGAEKVRAALNEIAVQAKKVSELMNEIAAAGQEQSQGIEQVNRAITQMETVTQRNASTAEENASASTELDTQARNLQKVVEQLLEVVNGRKSMMESGLTHLPVTHQPQISQGTSVNQSRIQSNSGLTNNNEIKTRVITPEEIIPLGKDPNKF
ncbi:MAG TPA: hypothetical protein DDW65_12385 [Firmicutes bacterium]|jgi:hypothetical protein|nr:hypothetical protein [Bacillota bacterium]